MPFLDVSDVLFDPDFCDAIELHRMTQSVSTNTGEATNTEAISTFYGVVTSDRGDVLRRMAAGEHIEGSIVIHSQTPLRDGGGLYASADEVVWANRRYVVTNVNDYSRFGAGFTAAICDLKPLAG